MGTARERGERAGRTTRGRAPRRERVTLRDVSTRELELEEAVRARSRGRLDLLAYAISPDAQWAATLLRVRETSYWLESLYQYGSDGWIEETTSNGVLAYSGVGEAEDGTPIGILRYYGKAPADSELALIRWRDEVHEVPVRHGHFAFAAWDASEHEGFDPEAVAFR